MIWRTKYQIEEYVNYNNYFACDVLTIALNV